MLETRSSPFLVGAPKRSRLVANNSQAIKRSPVIDKAGAPSKPVVVADPTPSANRGGKPSPSTGAAGPGGTDGWLTPRSEPKPGSLAERFWKVNIGDWHLLRGVPYVMRVASGLLKPNRRTPGLDMAGQVEAVGGGGGEVWPGGGGFGRGEG